MRQRVMIAIALVCKPSVLIADEPTTALDVTIQAQILSLITKLKEETGASIILITHDLAVVSETCDRVIVMYLGQIVEEADAREIFSNPKHPYTKGLMQSIPQMTEQKPERLYAIRGHRPASEPDRAGLPVRGPLRIRVRAVQKRNAAAAGAGKWTHGQMLFSAGSGNMNETQAMLELQHLKKFFPVEKKVNGQKAVVKAVNDVSLQVHRNEVYGLVGETGCGKSTLGRTMLRLLEPTDGRILYQGEDITKNPSAGVPAVPVEAADDLSGPLYLAESQKKCRRDFDRGAGHPARGEPRRLDEYGAGYH